jgi:hypothetical protein
LQRLRRTQQEIQAEIGSPQGLFAALFDQMWEESRGAPVGYLGEVTTGAPTEDSGQVKPWTVMRLLLQGSEHAEARRKQRRAVQSNFHDALASDRAADVRFTRILDDPIRGQNANV